MKQANVTIKNETGLHARPAATVINAAKGFASKLTLKRGDREVNLKSLISLLSLGICKGEEITLTAEGEDEDLAIQQMTNLLNCLED